MSSNKKYTIRLIEQAKQGRKNQFIELSLNFLPRIYSIVFGLVPNIEAAQKICAEVFYIIWKRIKSIETDSDFATELQEIAIVRSFIYLESVEKIELDDKAIEIITKGDNEFFTHVEKEFLHLTYKQRVILVLNDKLELPTIKIAEVLKTLSVDEIREELHTAREILLIKFPDGKLAEFPEHGWVILNDCLMKLDKGIDQYLEDDVLEFISEYLQQSKGLLHGIFGKITPDNEIVNYLKSDLLKESSNDTTKKKLVTFSNNYTSVATKSKEVSFEKAFIATDQTYSEIEANLESPIQHKLSSSKFKYLLGVVGLLLLFFFLFTRTENTWIPKKGDGNFELNNSLNHIVELTENTKISTKESATVEITNNNSSNIKLKANTSLELNELKDHLTTFTLFKGSIVINNKTKDKKKNSKEVKLIKIEVNNVEIVSYKGKSSVSFSKKNGLNVTTQSGNIEIRLLNETYYLAKNYKFRMKPNNEYIIPFNKNANYRLIELIKTIDPNNIDKLTILKIINASSKRDYLTLFNLLLISDVSNRKLLLNKLNEFFPLKTIFVWNNLVNLEEKDIEFFRNFLINNF